jgi:hypothetical protein
VHTRCPSRAGTTVDVTARPAAPVEAEELIDACLAMDAAGVPVDASPETITAVALVLRAHEDDSRKPRRPPP